MGAKRQIRGLVKYLGKTLSCLTIHCQRSARHFLTNQQYNRKSPKIFDYHKSFGLLCHQNQPSVERDENGSGKKKFNYLCSCVILRKLVLKIVKNRPSTPSIKVCCLREEKNAHIRCVCCPDAAVECANLSWYYEWDVINWKVHWRNGNFILWWEDDVCIGWIQPISLMKSTEIFFYIHT